jgi:hypothetical protein
MTVYKKIGIGLLALLIIIQFIRPSRNIASSESENEITKKYSVPENVKVVLQESCYDCHSNTTRYPWYTNIQPVGWWIQSHVNEGKEHLNFSEFGAYSEKKAKHKFEEIEESMNTGWMPLESYLIIHRDAKLTTEQADAMRTWAAALK